MSQQYPQDYDPRQQQPVPYGYGQPPYQQQSFVQPPVQVNVQQFAGGPGYAVTQRGLGPFWTAFHLLMTLGSGGLWGVIWYWHYRSRRSVTTFR